MKKRRALIGLFVLFTLAQLAHCQIKFLPAALLQLAAEDCGVSITAVGMAVSACTVASGLSPLLASLLIDRRGGAATMAASALLAGAAGVLPGLWAGYPALLAGCILCGIGVGFSFCATPVLIAQYLPVRYRAPALSVSFALYSGFTALAYSLPGYTLELVPSWRTLLLFWGVFSLAAGAGLLLLRGLPDGGAGPARTGAGGGQAGLLRAARVPSVCLLTLVMTCFIWVNNTYSTYLPHFLEQLRGAELRQAGLITGASFLCGIFGCLLAGALADRFHRQLLYGFPFLILAGGLGLGLSRDFGVLAACSGLFGFAYQGWIPLAYAVFMKDPRLDAGALGGAAALFDGVGHVLTLLIPAAYSGLSVALRPENAMLATSFLLFFPPVLQIVFHRLIGAQNADKIKENKDISPTR